MTMKFIFSPVAQNTIIRPLAEAVCMVQGGQPVKYIDTADHKEKQITLQDLSFLSVDVRVNRRAMSMNGDQVAFQARHKPIQIQVDINDIPVIISNKTTVEAAMAQYRRKFELKNPELSRN